MFSSDTVVVWTEHTAFSLCFLVNTGCLLKGGRKAGIVGPWEKLTLPPGPVSVSLSHSVMSLSCVVAGHCLVSWLAPVSSRFPCGAPAPAAFVMWVSGAVLAVTLCASVFLTVWFRSVHSVANTLSLCRSSLFTINICIFFIFSPWKSELPNNFKYSWPWNIFWCEHQLSNVYVNLLFSCLEETALSFVFYLRITHLFDQFSMHGKIYFCEISNFNITDPIMWSLVSSFFTDPFPFLLKLLKYF